MHLYSVQIYILRITCFSQNLKHQDGAGWLGVQHGLHAPTIISPIHTLPPHTSLPYYRLQAFTAGVHATLPPTMERAQGSVLLAVEQWQPWLPSLYLEQWHLPQLFE